MPKQLFLMSSMVRENAPVGVHLLMNLYDIPEIHVLKEIVHGRPILEDIVRELQLTVVSQTGFQFQPMGYTYAYVLSESHFTIHTYPEFRSAYLDIFCCNPDFNGIYAQNYIKRAFGTTNASYQVIQR